MPDSLKFEKSEIDIKEYLHILKFDTNRLQLVNLIVSITFIISIFLLFIAIFKPDFNSFYAAKIYEITVYILPGIGVLSLFLHELILKRSNNIYEEIVDEIEWEYKRNSDDIKFERLPLKFRLALKNYVRSRDLPFTSGKSGTLIYLIFFLAIIFTIAFELKLH
jgi:hypothetical protein